jgi:hypothetical protein
MYLVGLDGGAGELAEVDIVTRKKKISDQISHHHHHHESEQQQQQRYNIKINKLRL